MQRGAPSPTAPLEPLPDGPPADAASQVPNEVVQWRAGTTPDGWFRAEDVQRLVQALAALRAAAPDLSVSVRPRYAAGTMKVGLFDEPATPADALDSLDPADALYGGVRSLPSSQLPGAPKIELSFPLSLDLVTVARYYAALDGIRYAEPWGFGGDGSDVIRVEKADRWHLVVRHGSGDCPSGCIHNEYTWFTWDLATGAITRDQDTREQPVDENPLYGVPGSVLTRPFPTFGDVLDAGFDDRWWVAGDAAAVLGQLMCEDRPRYGADFDPPGHHDAVRADALAHRVDVARLLVGLLHHPDTEVRQTADAALVRWSGRSYPADDGRWDDWLADAVRAR